MTVQLSGDQLKAKFASANASANEEFSGLPEGQYYFRLDKSEMGKSKKLNPQIVHTFMTVSGDYKGKTHKMFTPLESESDVPLSIMFRMWRLLGFDTNGIGSNEELKAYCDAITAAKLHVLARVTKTPSADGRIFTNTAVEAIVEAPVEKPVAPAPATAAPVAPVAASKPVAPKPAAVAPAKPVAAPVPAAPVADAEPEPEPDPDTEAVNVTIDVGTKVKFKYKDSELEGVVKVLVDNDTIKVSSGGMSYTVKTSNVLDVM